MASNENKIEDKTYTPLFRRALTNKWIVWIFIIGGVFYSLFALLIALGVESPAVITGNVVTLFAFVPAILVILYMIRGSLVNKVDDIFIKENESVRELFSDKSSYLQFIQKSRQLFLSKKEYLLIAFFWIICLIFSPTIQAIFLESRLTELLSSAFAPVNLIHMYFFVFWDILSVAILGSIVWCVSCYIYLTLMLKKEKRNLPIMDALLKLMQTPALAANPIGVKEIEKIDISFAKLREGIAPIQSLGYSITLIMSMAGLFYALPAIAISIVSYGVKILDVGSYLYYTVCLILPFFIALIIFSTQGVVTEFWKKPKREATAILEKLSDKVRFQYIKSVASLEDYSARERQAHDVAFLRNAILDLKQLDTHEYTRSFLSRLAIALVLSYIPLILEIVTKLNG
jgi:hypothetical protein